jgi:hypothetical protein
LTYRHRRDQTRVPRGSPLHDRPTTRTPRSRVRKTQILSSFLVQMMSTTLLVGVGGSSAATTSAFSGAAQHWNILVGHSWAPRIKWAIAEVRDQPISLVHVIFLFHRFSRQSRRTRRWAIVTCCGVTKITPCEPSIRSWIRGEPKSNASLESRTECRRREASCEGT